MSAAKPVVALALVGLLSTLPACGGAHVPGPAHGEVDGLEIAARARAVQELACDDISLSSRSIGAGGYRVEGCGGWITYTCVKSMGGVVCSPNERGSIAIDPSREWSDEDVRTLLARTHDDVIGCLPPDSAGATLHLDLERDGTVRRATHEPLERLAAECVDERLAREHLGRSVMRARRVVLEFRRGRGAGGVVVPGGAPAPAAGGTSADAAARAVIDARAASILACVEADALSMQVSWSASGQLDALLRGERQGTPEESCVRGIVQRLTIAAPGAAGTIVHAVQR